MPQHRENFQPLCNHAPLFAVQKECDFICCALCVNKFLASTVFLCRAFRTSKLFSHPPRRVNVDDTRSASPFRRNFSEKIKYQAAVLKRGRKSREDAARLGTFPCISDVKSWSVRQKTARERSRIIEENDWWFTCSMFLYQYIKSYLCILPVTITHLLTASVDTKILNIFLYSVAFNLHTFYLSLDFSLALNLSLH